MSEPMACCVFWQLHASCQYLICLDTDRKFLLGRTYFLLLRSVDSFKVQLNTFAVKSMSDFDICTLLIVRPWCFTIMK